MPDRLRDRAAIITGSTSGIGRATAELFAEEGASVVINDDGGQRAQGEEIAQGIIDRGGRAAYFQADVGSGADLQALVRHAVDTFGRLDILVNNAIAGRHAPLLEQDEAGWDRVFATSVKACFLGSKFAIPEMLKSGGGAIVSTSSVHGLLAGRGGPAYDSAKAAIINLTRQMAVEYGPQGIRVNAVCPGWILTERRSDWFDKNPDVVRRRQAVYPLGRQGFPREVAMAALFLVSDESSFVTGHALVVDGGLTAQLQDSAVIYVEETSGA